MEYIARYYTPSEFCGIRFKGEVMINQQHHVFKITDVPFVETQDGTMRDSFMITEATCNAQGVTAGLVFVPPHAQNHEDTHTVEEVFYIIQGHAKITYDGVGKPVEAGDVVFMPAGVAHRVVNDSDETYIAFWAIMNKLSSLGALEDEFKTWHEIQPNEGWSRWQYA